MIKVRGHRVLQPPSDRDRPITLVRYVRSWPQEEIRRGAELVVLLFSNEEQDGARPRQIPPSRRGRDRGCRLTLPVEQRGADRVVAIHRGWREVRVRLLQVDEERIDVLLARIEHAFTE